MTRRQRDLLIGWGGALWVSILAWAVIFTMFGAFIHWVVTR